MTLHPLIVSAVVLLPARALLAPQAQQAGKEVLGPAPRLPVLVLEGTAHERGLLHGKTLKKQIHELVKLWKEDLAQRFKTDANSFIRRFVKQTDYRSAMKKWTPDLLDEIKGIAEGSGI